MSAASNYSENLFADWIMGVANMPATTPRYLALYTAITDAEAGTGTEVNGFGYGRVLLDTASAVDPSSGGINSILTNVSFPAASGGTWGSVVGVAIRDASTGGNPISRIYSLSSPITVNNGETLRFEAGNFTVQVQ